MRAGIVAAMLLLVAGEARAECAWVLWVTNTERQGTPRTEIASTYWTADECTAAIDEQDRAFRSRDAAVVLKQARTTLHLHFRNKDGTIANTALSWLCAPDTVDPRGAKRERG